MKAFKAKLEVGGISDFYVIFAKTETQAIRLAIKENPTSNSNDWRLTEIECKGAVYIGTDYSAY